MSRPETIEELELVYSQMHSKWINSPEKWSIDAKLSVNDTRTCLAIYSLDKCKLKSYAWNRLTNWLKPLQNFGILYNNTPSDDQGLLHFTFHQLSKINTNENNFNLDNCEILHDFLKKISGLNIIYRGLIITPTGIALRGYPSDDLQLKKLMNARNELEIIMKKIGITYDPPYTNDICHATLFRWTKKPTQEIIEYIQKGLNNWSETVIAELQPKSWCIGAGTFMMLKPNRRDFISFYCPIFIAHRGLIEGPNKEKENSINILKERSKQGKYSECDIWKVNDNLFIGHDKPETQIQFEDINSSYLFLHAKNKEAFEYLINKATCEGFNLNIFWHTEEDYVLTNHGDIIVYPGKELIEESIFMMPENASSVKNNGICKYICSDYSFTK